MSDVRTFGAAGDGQQDDTLALQHALNSGDGVLELPRGDYRITKPLVVQLAQTGRFALRGSGGTARLLMAGSGPAIVLQGTHAKTADPKDFQPSIWESERMPTVADIEITGTHPEADGIRITGVMQASFTGVLLRKLRTAISITGRARNLLINNCHIYHNTGIGVHLDQVNLHQMNITGSHISYCRRGGIRIEASEVRNLQITGNDIEYNNNRPHQIPGADGEPTAEIYIDCRQGSIREGTIASNTLQATYSPNGANIRFIGAGADANHKVGLFTIAGNLIGSQENNIHLSNVRGVSITGNVLYSGHSRNLLLENCRNIAVGSNVFDHNPDYNTAELCTGIRLVESVDCSLNGLTIQDSQAGKHTVKDAGPQSRDALIEIERCRRIGLVGCQIIDGAPYGVIVRDSSEVLIQGCQILEGRPSSLMTSAIRWLGDGIGNLISGCRLHGGDRAIDAPKSVHRWNNLTGD